MEKRKKGVTTWLNSGNNNHDIGLNFHEFTHVHENGKMETIIVDYGNKFEDVNLNGIDQIVLNEADKLSKASAVFLTHGHLDHIGSLVHAIARKQKVPPIYGSPYTLKVLRGLVKDLGVNDADMPEMNLITKDNSVIKVGAFEVSGFSVSHSIPDALAFGIKTPATSIFMTGDYRMNPMDFSHETDLEGIKAWSKENNVEFMLADSTSVENKNAPVLESTIQDNLTNIFMENNSKDISVFNISNNLPRLRSVAIAAARAGFGAVLIGGRAAVNAWENCRDVARFDVQDDMIKSINRDLKQMGLSEIKVFGANYGIHKARELGLKAIFARTGSNAEPNSEGDKMANDGLYAGPEVGENSLMVFVQRPIPGNERQVEEMIASFVEQGASIVPHEGIYTSGHAGYDEAHLLTSEIAKASGNPWFTVIPVHGSLKLRDANTQLADDLGLHSVSVHQGDVVQLEAGLVYKMSNYKVNTLAVMSEDGLNKAEIVVRYYKSNESEKGQHSVDYDTGIVDTLRYEKEVRNTPNAPDKKGAKGKGGKKGSSVMKPALINSDFIKDAYRRMGIAIRQRS